jgi:hypothetical protein
VAIVVVEPRFGTVPIAVEKTQVVVLVAYCSKSACATTLRILAGLNFIWHLNALDSEPSNFIF